MNIDDTLDAAPLGAWTGQWKLPLPSMRMYGKTVVENECKRVLEFGSGGSTYLLAMLKALHGYPQEVTSLDHDPKYAHPAAIVRPLVDYPQPLDPAVKLWDCDYGPVLNPAWTRAPWRFYALEEGDLTGIYDLVMVDGPFGRGRSIAYHAIIDHIAPGTLIIDDWRHLPFEADMQARLKIAGFDVVERSRTRGPRDTPADGSVVYEIVKG